MRRLNNLKVAHLVGNIPSTVLEVALYFNADMHTISLYIVLLRLWRQYWGLHEQQ